MEIVPAPSRQFKSYSMILGIALGSFDAFVLLLNALSEAHVLSATALLIINAVAAFLIVPAKLIQQSISATPDQKAEIVESAKSIHAVKG